MRRVALLLVAVGCAGTARVAGPENRIACAGPHTLADRATGRLQGRVTDSASDAPLADLEVSVGVQVTRTDADGRWAIGNLPEGEYRVAVRRGGRTLYETPVHLCPEDVTTLRTPVRQGT
jgi:hypothetical protein